MTQQIQIAVALADIFICYALQVMKYIPVGIVICAIAGFILARKNDRS